MSKKDIIESFLSFERIAVAGVSRNDKKFGSIVFRDLKKKGYEVVPVNPDLTEIDGIKCYPSVDEIPGDLHAMITVIPPEKTVQLLNNLQRKDIMIIWMQSGSESEEALGLCRKKNINYVEGECILMYAEPEGFHKFHRFINKIFGKLPV
jgi:uncharacterized protein